MIDSTVLAEVLTLLNKRYNYGVELFLLSIDEGITGYRDDSLEVQKNPLHKWPRCILDSQEKPKTVSTPAQNHILQGIVQLDNG